MAKILTVVLLCLPLGLMVSCGAEQGAPPGSTITVSPDEVPWEVALGNCTNTFMHDTYFDIVVKSPSGTPLTGVDIRVTLDLAPGSVTPAGIPGLMFLFDALDGDNIYDDPITSFPYFTNTGNGTKTLMVRYDLGSLNAGSCTYAGNLNVYSGTSFGSANISVEEAS